MFVKTILLIIINYFLYCMFCENLVYSIKFRNRDCTPQRIYKKVI